LNSGAQQNCVDCPADPGVLGLLAGVRGGYRFPFGLALELTFGYLRVGSSFSRTIQLAEQPDVTYSLEDSLLVHGPFGAFGLGYRYAVHEYVGLGARVAAGALLSSSRDEISAVADKAGSRAEVTIQGSQPVARAASVFLSGQVGVDFRVDGFTAGLGFGLLGLVTKGGVLADRSVAVPLSCSPGTGGSVGCIRTGTPLPDEAGHGLALLFWPELDLGYAF
jgi:hypothetical protein